MNIKKSPACRKKGETKKECVSRKVPEILDENPGMDREQAVAIAYSVCKKSCTTKFLTTAEIIELAANDDKLPLSKINKRMVKTIRPDMLYRTHMALHKEANGSIRSKKLIKAHEIVADELKARGFMHHSWDKLDSIYQE